MCRVLLDLVHCLVQWVYRNKVDVPYFTKFRLLLMPQHIGE